MTEKCVMKFVVKLFSEITIKSRPVRKLLVKQLAQNIRNTLHKLSPSVTVKSQWDAIEVCTAAEASESFNEDVYSALACIPGIAHINQVREFPLGSLDDIVAQTLSVWGDALIGKTFLVRAKREGKHTFSSMDLERYVGGGLCRKSLARGVDLHNPDVLIRLEVREQKVFIIDQRLEGLGGLPLGAAGSSVVLVSGGFDSTVAAYQMIRRGVRAHFLFFNLGGAAHENGVKEVIYYLWKKYGSSHKVKFTSVPFEAVVEEILTQVEDRYMGIILKRMMMRAANAVCERMAIDSFVTGESLSQVSSQTMMNLRLIDDVADRLVIRPLAVTDKPTIVDLARDIGMASFVERIPEYCGVVSRKPNAACKRHDVERVELAFDLSVLDGALTDAKVESIDTMDWQPVLEMATILNESLDCGQAIVIDVRHPQEIELAPLTALDHPHIEIPFYRLNRVFKTLDQNKAYLLYCDKGVMSKMHALHLADAGFSNIGVYQQG